MPLRQGGSQSPPNRVNGSHLLYYYKFVPICVESQSPPNRVNGSHFNRQEYHDLLKQGSQSPPNRVNGSHHDELPDMYTEGYVAIPS